MSSAVALGISSASSGPEPDTSSAVPKEIRVGSVMEATSAFDEMDAEPPEQDRAHAIRRGERHMGRDARPHGIAHHVGALDAEMIEEPAPVLGHAVGIVGHGVIELLALSMAAIVERDRPVSGPRQ